jgi:hypothetical protein
MKSGNLERPKIFFKSKKFVSRDKINPTNLIELFLRSGNLGRPKINPTNLIGQINPTKLVGFKKSSQNWSREKPYLFDRTYSAFCAFCANHLKNFASFPFMPRNFAKILFSSRNAAAAAAAKFFQRRRQRFPFFFIFPKNFFKFFLKFSILILKLIFAFFLIFFGN